MCSPGEHGRPLVARHNYRNFLEQGNNIYWYQFQNKVYIWWYFKFLKFSLILFAGFRTSKMLYNDPHHQLFIRCQEINVKSNFMKIKSSLKKIKNNKKLNLMNSKRTNEVLLKSHTFKAAIKFPLYEEKSY